MCGIAGWLDWEGGVIPRERLAAAAEAQRHRGPDHTGIWIESSADAPFRDAAGWSAGLAAVRLAVQDPRPQANQPLSDAQGRYVLVYNGELYNADELRTELSRGGWAFRTTGDTEVVLAACATWGAGGLARLNGMFALAFVDRQRRRGMLARDPFGIKPLLYAVVGARLLFASEMGALAALGEFDRVVDPHALAHLLAFGYIVHPETVYRGARRLPPGHVLEFDERGPGQSGRYSFDLSDPAVGVAAQDEPCDVTLNAAELRDRIRRAVVRQHVSDVPLGCFLSGGVDSSIVALHLSEASTMPVRTFTIGYADKGLFDESGFARDLARRLGTNHTECLLTHRDVLDAVPSVLDHLHEPFGDSSIIPTTLVSRLARRQVTVALSGDGSDELFGGYWRYLAHAAANAYRRLPAWIRTWIIEPWAGEKPTGKSSGGVNRVRQFRKLLRAGETDALQRHIAWARILPPEAESLLARPGLLSSVLASTLERMRALAGSRVEDACDLNAVLAVDVQYGLPGDMLHKVDLASMSCSLEVRVPFLDPSVVQLAMRMPFAGKIDRGLRKRRLIDAYRGLLPDDVLDRPKRGFEVPFGEYLRGPLLGLFRDVVTRAAIDSIGLLEYDAVARLLQAHLDRRQDYGDLLFTLLSLCWWRGRGHRQEARNTWR